MIGECLSEAGDTEPAKDFTPIDVRRAAMDFLARREHSRRELRQKLSRRFPDCPYLTEVLDNLLTDNLQSDSRFAEIFVRSRARRGIGPRRIVRELADKGVENAIIDHEMAVSDVDWNSLAEKVLHKRFGTESPVSPGERAKRQRFMYQRGFAHGTGSS